MSITLNRQIHGSSYARQQQTMPNQIQGEHTLTLRTDIEIVYNYFSRENVTKLVQTLRTILNLSTINAKLTNLQHVRTSLRPVSYIEFNSDEFNHGFSVCKLIPAQYECVSKVGILTVDS